MKFTYALRQGNRPIVIEDDVANQKELWEKIAFLDSIPTKAPDGAEVIFRHRLTSEGDAYYSVYCPATNKEFMFGQHKKNDTLFPKVKQGWQAAFAAANPVEESRGQSTALSVEVVRQCLRDNGHTTVGMARQIIRTILGREVNLEDCTDQELARIYGHYHK